MSRLLSVVVPCFNEEAVVVETHRRLSSELERIGQAHDLAYEILYLNDGSRDRTLDLLHQIHAEHSARASRRGDVVVVALARRFGHQLAVTAGLELAQGDAVVVIDADLQDPPAVIEAMVERWNAGADVAYGVRESRQGESAFKRATASLFYRVMRRMTGIDIPADAGDFRLLSRRVVDVFNRMPERHRFIRGMIPWIGFRQEPVPYARAARFAGTTKYPFMKMLRLAFDGVTAFSNIPLKLTYWLGFSAATFSLAWIVWVVVDKLWFGTPVRGWSSLMAVILFLGAAQLITIGIVGEYIGRIYDEVKKRPLFVVDETASRGRAPVGSVGQGQSASEEAA